MALDIQDIVRVEAQIAPGGAAPREFGRTLLVTTDATLPVDAGRVRVFATIDEVASVFPPGSSPVQAARVYFSQVPYPRHLVIGRWINTREPSRLTGGTPLSLEEITGRPTVVIGTGTVADLVNFHGRATVLTGGSPASLVNFHGRATVVTGTGTVADLVNFHGRATVLTGGSPASLVNFHGRATVVTGTGTVADLVNFHGRATVVTGTGTVASLDTFHGRATVLTGTGTVASLTTLQGITSGTVTFLSQTVTGLDFSSDTDLDGVASTLQTALRATSSTDLDNVEVAYDSTASAFVVTLPLDSTGVVPTVSAAFTGAESDELGLDTATIVDGVDAIVSGTVTFLSETVTGLDFSDVTDYDDVAAVVQTGLRGTSETDLDEVEVVYDSTASAFVVTLPLDSTGVVPTVSAAFTGAESDELGLDTATIVDGVDAIVSGTVTFLSQTVTGLDFSAVTDLDGVASTLQTALRATSSTDLDNVEVDYDGSVFVVTLPLDSTGVVPTVSAAFTGAESDELGLDTATIVNGVDAIRSGTITFLSETVTGLDFSSVTDLDGVASTLQTALRATSATSLDEVEVDYDGSVFVVTLPLDSTGAATSVSAAFTGTESDELGLDTATIVNGVDAIVSGTVTFLSETVTGLDFSSVTDYDGVASTLQTALRATDASNLDNVEVVYDGSAFVVTLPLDSSTGVVPTADASFTGDDADELGLDTATIVNGVDAIVSGSVTFLSQTLTGLDFSDVTDLDGVASVLQTALRATGSADLDNAEVVYDGTAFVVTLPLDSTTGAATSVSAAFTGDDADELGLDTATIVNGVSVIKSGDVTFLGASVTGLDFSTVTDYDDVATVLQTALRGASIAGLAQADVRYVDQGFVATLPLDSTTGAATAVTDPFTGSSAAPLGLDTVDMTPGIDGIGAGAISWQGSTISGLDFTDATSYADVADTLQTALRAVRAAARADLRSATVTYDPAGFFLVELGFDPSGDEPYPITGYIADVVQSAAFVLGLDSEGVVITQGHVSEAIEEAMDAISRLNDTWYFVAVDSSIVDTESAVSLAQWVQARQQHMLSLDTTETEVVTPNESSSIAARLSSLGLDRTFVVWSRSADHKALSMAARLSSVRFDGLNTLITAKFKSLPGTAPDALTSAQQEELDRKRVNYYTRFGQDAIFAEGWALKSGTWIDVRYWLDWITSAIQTEVYNLLRQHPSRVPQTNEGIASITTAIERVCEAGRRNGGIAPGQVAESVANDIRLATNNPAFDGFLALGYLVTAGSIADQLQADRDARRSPAVRVWVKGSGAIHFATIELVFSG